MTCNKRYIVEDFKKEVTYLPGKIKIKQGNIKDEK
jgi:hypothetical protein